MGCTSSAPSMTPSETHSENNQNITEIEEKLSENKSRTEIKDFEVKEEKYSENASKKDDAIGEVMIPACDETLVRNTSIEEAPSLESQHQENFPESNEERHEEDKHLRDINITTEAESNLDKPADISKAPESPKAIQPYEKISTLEEVVDKVVEFYITDKLDSLDIKQKDSSTTNEEERPVNSEMDMDDAPDSIVYEERAPSPSQSSSSRATRWEALADMAAELPPSLTVDPVTGQIYTLSK